MESRGVGDTCVPPSVDAGSPAPAGSPLSRFQTLNQCLQLAHHASSQQDFQKAIHLCSQFLDLDCEGGSSSASPSAGEKATVLSYRARFHIELADFESALQDANASLDASDKCVLAYICKAECLIALGRMADAMVVYASALFHTSTSTANNDNTNTKQPSASPSANDVHILMERFVSCCQDDLSPIKDSFNHAYSSVSQLGLSGRPAVLLATVGHALLSLGYNSAAMAILQLALHCRSHSLNIHSLILSGLTSAKWAAGCFEEALQLMEEDLSLSVQMNDYSQQVRCLANLGAAYYSMGDYPEALKKENHLVRVSCEWHRLCGCEEAKEATALALSRQGRALQAMHSLPAALDAFKASVSMYAHTGNTLQHAQQFANTGIVYALMGELEQAVECHQKQLEMVQREADAVSSPTPTPTPSGATQPPAKQGGSGVEVSRAYSLQIAQACYFLGFDYCQMRRYSDALQKFHRVLEIGESVQDSRIQMKALHGIGATFLQLKQPDQSLEAHQKQLKLAQSHPDDVTLHIQALTNVSLSHCEKGEFNSAIQLLKQALSLPSQQGHTPLSPLLAAKLSSHIANCYAALGNYEEAINHFTKVIENCRNSGDKVTQCKAVGFLGLAYQCNKEFVNAETSLLQQEALANSIPESPDLLVAAKFNLGNFYTSTEQFNKARKYFEAILAIVEKHGDGMLVARVLSFLGYIFFRLQDFKRAIQKYKEAMLQCQLVDDQGTLCQVLYHLGLVHQVLGKFHVARLCYQTFYHAAHQRGDRVGEFRSLGALGNTHVFSGDLQSARDYYQQQLSLAVHHRDGELEIEANSYLGLLYLKTGDWDVALQHFSKMRELSEARGNVTAKCHATLFLGRVHTRLNNFHTAAQCFDDTLNLAIRFGYQCFIPDVYSSMAECQQADKQFQQAILTYNQVLRFLHEGEEGTTGGGGASGSGSGGARQQQQQQMDKYSNLNLQVMSDASLRISVLHNIAQCYSQLAEWRQALSVLETLFDFCVGRQRWPACASAFRDTVQLLIRADNSSCSDYLLQLIDRCPPDIASILSSSPWSRHASKFLSAAGDSQPLNTIEECPFHAPLYDYASFLMDGQRYQEAIPLLERSVGFVGGGSRQAAKTASSQLAIAICYHRGAIDQQKALAAYEAALQAAQSLSAEDEAKLAMAQLCFGSFLVDSNNLEEGLDMLKQCVEVSGRIEDSEIQQKACARVAAAYFQQGLYPQAAPFFHRALLSGAAEMTSSNKGGWSCTGAAGEGHGGRSKEKDIEEQMALQWDWALKNCRCHLEMGDLSKCVADLDKLQQQISSYRGGGGGGSSGEEGEENSSGEFLEERASAYLQCLQLRISLSLAKGDVNKSLFYCNLHKSIKTQTLNLQPTSAALQDIFASDQTMTSLEHECLDGLNKCLDEESCCFLCFHCDDTVFHAWLFNKHILLTHSESLADLRRDYGIESAQTVADFFGFLSRRLLETIDDEDSGVTPIQKKGRSNGASGQRSVDEWVASFGRLFLPESFVGALQQSQCGGVQRLRFILDEATLLTPLNMLRLDPQTLLGEVFEIGVMLKLSHRQGGMPEKVETKKVISIFGSSDRPVKTSLDAISDLCGGQSDVSFCDVTNSTSLQLLMEDLYTHNSSQVCFVNFKFDWCSASRKVEGISLVDANSVDYRNCKISFEEIMSFNINKKLIILCLSPSASLDCVDICEGLFLTMCAFMGAGAQCIIASQLPVDEAFFLSKFTQPFLIDILEGSTVEAATQNVTRRMRVKRSSKKSASNQQPWFGLLNVCAGSFPVCLRFNHYSTLAHLGHVLRVCPAGFEEKSGRDPSKDHVTLCLSFISEKISEALERLRNSNRHALVVSRSEQLKSMVVGANSVFKFLSCLKFKVETLPNDVMIHYPIVDFGLQLQFFLDLVSKMTRFSRSSWLGEVGKLFEDGDQALMVAISSYLETLFDSLSGVKLDKDTYSLRIDNLLLLSSPVFFSLMKCAKVKVNVRCDAPHDTSRAEVTAATRLADLRLLRDLINQVLQGPAPHTPQDTQDDSPSRTHKNNKLPTARDTTASDVETMSQQSGRSLNSTVRRAPKLNMASPNHRRHNAKLSDSSRLSKLPLLANESQLALVSDARASAAAFEQGNHSFVEMESLNRFRNSARSSFTELVTGPTSCSSKSDSRGAGANDTLVDFGGVQETPFVEGSEPSRPAPTFFSSCSAVTSSSYPDRLPVSVGEGVASNKGGFGGFRAPSSSYSNIISRASDETSATGHVSRAQGQGAPSEGGDKEVTPRGRGGPQRSTLSSEKSAFTPVIPRAQQVGVGVGVTVTPKETATITTSTTAPSNHSRAASGNMESQMTSSMESVNKKLSGNNKFHLPYQRESKPNNASTSKSVVFSSE